MDAVESIAAASKEGEIYSLLWLCWVPFRSEDSGGWAFGTEDDVNRLSVMHMLEIYGSG